MNYDQKYVAVKCLMSNNAKFKNVLNPFLNKWFEAQWAADERPIEGRWIKGVKSMYRIFFSKDPFNLS